MTRIDYRMLVISSAILAIAFALGWSATSLFRLLFPLVAASTLWDEITGPTVVTLALLMIKWLMYRQMVFHVWLTADITGDSPVHMRVQRRRRGWRMFLLPVFDREALVSEPYAMIRNVFWWGVFGVDRCVLRFERDAPKPTQHLIEVPQRVVRSHATVRVTLSAQADSLPHVVTKEQVET